MDSIERAAQVIAERERPGKATNALDPASSAEAASPTPPTPPTDPPPRRVEPAETPTPPRPHAPVQSEPPLEIDVARLAKLGFISPRHPVTRIAEEFRVIKQRVLQSAFHGETSGEASPRLVMVTSSQPREGKSFAAANLALSIATERDTHVMLIDADFLHPSVFKSLQLTRPKRGLLDLLADENLGFERVICRTNIDRLSIIDAGRGNALASEYLSSQRMRALCRELASRYEDRIVIFDTSPLLATSEPSILSHHVGQILFIVEAQRTSRSAVQGGLDLIHDYEKVSMILNRNRSISGSEGFGGYYEYYRSRNS